MLLSNVTLYSNDLDKMRDFYVNKLAFTLIENNEEAFKIEVGDSELEFIQNNSKEKSFYHFAFNIPKTQFKDSKEWAKNKVTLNKEDNEDEVYFKHLDAHSFYFIDPTNNIVEFISRNSIAPPIREYTFSAQSVINISEINITTNNVVSVGEQLINLESQ